MVLMTALRSVLQDTTACPVPMRRIKRVLNALLVSTVRRELSCPLLALMASTRCVALSLKTTAQIASRVTTASDTLLALLWSNVQRVTIVLTVLMHLFHALRVLSTML